MRMAGGCWESFCLQQSKMCVWECQRSSEVGGFLARWELAGRLPWIHKAASVCGWDRWVLLGVRREAEKGISLKRLLFCSECFKCFSLPYFLIGFCLIFPLFYWLDTIGCLLFLHYYTTDTYRSCILFPLCASCNYETQQTILFVSVCTSEHLSPPTASVTVEQEKAIHAIKCSHAKMKPFKFTLWWMTHASFQTQCKTKMWGGGTCNIDVTSSQW